MYFRDGLALERPEVLVPWLISEEDLARLLDSQLLRRVTRGYHTLETTLWGGIELTVGFHFEPRLDGKLREFEIFRTDPNRLSDQESFAELQEVLESRLGAPTESSVSDDWYPAASWLDQSYAVTHLVRNRFGDEELLRAKTSRAV